MQQATTSLFQMYNNIISVINVIDSVVRTRKQPAPVITCTEQFISYEDLPAMLKTQAI